MISDNNFKHVLTSVVTVPVHREHLLKNVFELYLSEALSIQNTIQNYILNFFKDWYTVKFRLGNNFTLENITVHIVKLLGTMFG